MAFTWYGNGRWEDNKQSIHHCSGIASVIGAVVTVDSVGDLTLARRRISSWEQAVHASFTSPSFDISSSSQLTASLSNQAELQLSLSYSHLTPGITSTSVFIQMKHFNKGFHNEEKKDRLAHVEDDGGEWDDRDRRVTKLLLFLPESKKKPNNETKQFWRCV